MSPIKIYSDGREIAHFPYESDFVPGAVDVQIDGVWYPATIGPPATLVVAGPDATGNPPGTIVLEVGDHYMRIRFTDNPELLILPVPGVITVLPVPPFEYYVAPCEIPDEES